MNLSPSWVEFLRSAGLEAVHWSSIGAGNAPDSLIMASAAAHGDVVLTHDLDFGAILAASGASRPSVVQLRADDLRPAIIGDQVVQALRQMSADLESGALVTVEPRRSRLKLLPLRRS